MPVTVAVDVMGGDFGPPVTIPAALAFLAREPDAAVVLVGREDAIAVELGRAQRAPDARLAVRHASEVVEMHESPSAALRTKKDSSMRVAINLVKNGEAQAAVSAGNTGALMATARFVLKTLPGIDRPAIASQLPAVRGSVTMLDLGANVDCTPEHLYQFAVMGAALVGALDHRENPTIGLLNIGEEEIKGNEVVKDAAELLRASGLNFRGNVEGDDIYLGSVDVIVCDGFVGNVALKTSEGLAKMLGTMVREEFTRGPLAKLSALAAMGPLKRIRARLDPRRYNGASLVGLRGIVMKSHGGADALAFECALHRAWEEARSGLLDRITARMAERMPDARGADEGRREAEPAGGEAGGAPGPSVPPQQEARLA